MEDLCYSNNNIIEETYSELLEGTSTDYDITIIAIKKILIDLVRTIRLRLCRLNLIH